MTSNSSPTKPNWWPLIGVVIFVLVSIVYAAIEGVNEPRSQMRAGEQPLTQSQALPQAQSAAMAALPPSVIEINFVDSRGRPVPGVVVGVNYLCEGKLSGLSDAVSDLRGSIDYPIPGGFSYEYLSVYIKQWPAGYGYGSTSTSIVKCQPWSQGYRCYCCLPAYGLLHFSVQNLWTPTPFAPITMYPTISPTPAATSTVTKTATATKTPVHSPTPTPTRVAVPTCVTELECLQRIAELLDD